MWNPHRGSWTRGFRGIREFASSHNGLLAARWLHLLLERLGTIGNWSEANCLTLKSRGSPGNCCEELERRGGQRHWHKEGAGRPTWPIKMPIKIMPHLAGGASNEPIFGEVGLNFWNKRRHEDNLKAHGGT